MLIQRFKNHLNNQKDLLLKKILFKNHIFTNKLQKLMNNKVKNLNR
jgi:hypothetical protein